MTGIVENDFRRVAASDAPMRIQYYRLNFCLNPRENARFRFSVRNIRGRLGPRKRFVHNRRNRPGRV